MPLTSPAPGASRPPTKHARVREHILSLIGEGLEAGRAIPSERELSRRFGVSRMTVRQAVETLVVDGVLHRHQGKGTFVAAPALDIQVRLTSFAQEMRRQGKEPGAVVLLAETVDAEPSVALALGLAPGDPVHHLRRLLTADAIPIALEESWVPASLLPDLLTGALTFCPYEELAAAGLEPQWGEDVIESRMVPTEASALLGVPEHSAALAIERRAFHGDLVVLSSRSLYRSDRYSVWVPLAVPAQRRRRHPRASAQR